MLDIPSEYVSFLVEHSSAFRFHPAGRRLTSGRTSHWYFDSEPLLSAPLPRNYLCDSVVEECRKSNWKPDYFLNVPEGTNILATELNRRSPHTFGMIMLARAKPKEGDDDPIHKYFTYGVRRGDRVVIVDDGVETGGSLMTQIERCREAGLNVIGAVCLLDRMKRVIQSDGKDTYGAVHALRYLYDVKLQPLGTAAEVLQPVFEKLWGEGMISDADAATIAEGIEREYEEEGITEIKLRVPR